MRKVSSKRKRLSNKKLLSECHRISQYLDSCSKKRVPTGKQPFSREERERGIIRPKRDKASGAFRTAHVFLKWDKLIRKNGYRVPRHVVRFYKGTFEDYYFRKRDNTLGIRFIKAYLRIVSFVNYLVGYRFFSTHLLRFASKSNRFLSKFLTKKKVKIERTHVPTSSLLGDAKASLYSPFFSFFRKLLSFDKKAFDPKSHP